MCELGVGAAVGPLLPLDLFKCTPEIGQMNGIQRRHADIERTLSKLPFDDYFCVAVDATGNHVGFLYLQVQRDFYGARACDITVLRASRGRDGKGIGRAQRAQAEKWAKQNGCKLLPLLAFPNNAGARALCESIGFDPDLPRRSSR